VWGVVAWNPAWVSVRKESIIHLLFCWIFIFSLLWSRSGLILSCVIQAYLITHCTHIHHTYSIATLSFMQLYHCIFFLPRTSRATLAGSLDCLPNIYTLAIRSCDIISFIPSIDKSPPSSKLAMSSAASTKNIVKLAELLPAHLRNPQVGIVCGSGLGTLAESITERVIIPYSTLEGFGESTGASVTTSGYRNLPHVREYRSPGPSQRTCLWDGRRCSCRGNARTCMGHRIPAAST
jgi:hypothetical protein